MFEVDNMFEYLKSYKIDNMIWATIVIESAQNRCRFRKQIKLFAFALEHILVFNYIECKDASQCFERAQRLLYVASYVESSSKIINLVDTKSLDKYSEKSASLTLKTYLYKDKSSETFIIHESFLQSLTTSDNDVIDNLIDLALSDEKKLKRSMTITSKTECHNNNILTLSVLKSSLWNNSIDEKKIVKMIKSVKKNKAEKINKDWTKQARD